MDVSEGNEETTHQLLAYGIDDNDRHFMLPFAQNIDNDLDCLSRSEHACEVPISIPFGVTNTSLFPDIKECRVLTHLHGINLYIVKNSRKLLLDERWWRDMNIFDTKRVLSRKRRRCRTGVDTMSCKHSLISLKATASRSICYWSVASEERG